MKTAIRFSQHLDLRFGIIAGFFLLLVLQLGTRCAVSQEVVDRETKTATKVMSFNLRFGTANDGENRWENRTELVTEAIQRNQPDLLGTQETLPFQAEFLSQKFPEFQRVGRSREPDNQDGEQCALYFRKARYDLLASGHFWLSESPDLPGSKSWDSSLPRMATWVRLYDRENKRAVFFLNTHFDHRGEKARQESASLIKHQIQHLAADAAVVITGDFNAAADSVAHQRLTMEGGISVIDSFAKVHQPDEMETGTFNGFKGTKNGARIDWILCDSGSWIVESSDIEDYHVDGKYPSDHFPVIAKLQMQ